MTSAVCSPAPHFATYSRHALFMERPYTRESNNAGAPLPIIPRHTPSSSRFSSALSVPTSSATAAASNIQTWIMSTSQAKLVVQPPTPPDANTRPPAAQVSIGEPSSSSSSSSESYVRIPTRSRRSRSPIPARLCPPEHSTPTPTVSSAKSMEEQSSVSWHMRQQKQLNSPNGQEETPRPSTVLHKPVPTKPISRLHINLPSTVILPTGSSSSSSSTLTGISTPTRSVSAAPLVRKKSGEPLKSSLKSRRSVVRGDLSVVTGLSASKSEPNTPTHIKSVHFDDKLEHVKLFLAEQKPLAVSRDGSPTDDTSGTDSDFPSFIYGKSEPQVKESDEERFRKALNVEVASPLPRLGPAVPLPFGTDVLLESLTLSADHLNILGNVLVRNIAFEKWVAVRFTFDDWQTTSEVTAKYIESAKGDNVDRFAFRIRLNDMMMRLAEKQLVMAVRYSVAGREIWDNNFGKNYNVRFKFNFPPPVQVVSPVARAANETKMADLKNRLEQVAKGRETVGRVSVGHPTSPSTTAQVASSSRRVSTPPADSNSSDGFSLTSGVPLASRYDFSASLKSPPWKARQLLSPSSSFETEDGPRRRTSTYPTTFPNFPRRSEPPSVSRGSPRIVDHDYDDQHVPGFTSPIGRSNHHDGSDQEDTPVAAIPFPSKKSSKRNHSRGYFDLGVKPSSGLRRTPPGTPVEKSKDLLAAPSMSATITRYNSFPPTNIDPSRGHRSPSPSHLRALSPTGELAGWPLSFALGGSEDSTPSVTSNSNSSSQASSRSSSPVGDDVGPRGFLGLARMGSPVEDTSNYNVFLNRFCFFTGTDSPVDVPGSDAIHRSHSTSSVEGLLSSPVTTRGHYYPSPTDSTSTSSTPTRSSSLDDVSGSASGSSTPTPAMIRGSGLFGGNESPPVPITFVH